jgi:hypothetical protein
MLPLAAYLFSAVASSDEGAPINIVRVEPQIGSAVEGTVVEIRGTDFPPNPQVFFGDIEATVLSADVRGGLDRLLVEARARTDQRVDIRIVDPAHPDRVGMSAVLAGQGFEFIGETVIVPVLTGVVTNKSNAKAVVGAHVTVMPGNRAGIADLKGSYNVVLPSAGSYTVRAYASGFRSKSKVAHIDPSQAISTLNLDLEPLAPGPLDSDGDGLSDADETAKYGTDPLNPDTDSDGLSDGNEVLAGLDPLDFFDGDLFRRADTNSSGTVDALDLQFVINAVLQRSGNAAADLNGDRSVSAIDVQLAINVIIGTLPIQ